MRWMQEQLQIMNILKTANLGMHIFSSRYASVVDTIALNESAWLARR